MFSHLLFLGQVQEQMVQLQNRRRLKMYRRYPGVMEYLVLAAIFFSICFTIALCYIL